MSSPSPVCFFISVSRSRPRIRRSCHGSACHSSRPSSVLGQSPLLFRYTIEKSETTTPRNSFHRGLPCVQRREHFATSRSVGLKQLPCKSNLPLTAKSILFSFYVSSFRAGGLEKTSFRSAPHDAFVALKTRCTCSRAQRLSSCNAVPSTPLSVQLRRTARNHPCFAHFSSPTSTHLPAAEDAPIVCKSQQTDNITWEQLNKPNCLLADYLHNANTGLTRLDRCPTRGFCKHR